MSGLSSADSDRPLDCDEGIMIKSGMGMIQVRCVPEQHLAALARRARRLNVSQSHILRLYMARIAKAEPPGVEAPAAQEGTRHADISDPSILVAEPSN